MQDNNMGFNPETLEYEALEENLNPAFSIDNDSKADWAVRKIKEARAEFDRISKIAADERAEIDAKLSVFEKRISNQINNLMMMLDGYYAIAGPTKTTKTQAKRELLSGALVMKKQQPEYVRDEAALLTWAETTVPELVKVKKEVSWADLKKQADVSGDKLLLDGEIIPGVTVVEREDVFEVQI